MFLGDISACFILYLSAFIYKMGWLLYLAIFDQGFLAFFIIPTLYKIIHTGHLVFIFFSCLFSPQSLYSSAFSSIFISLYFRHYVLLYIVFPMLIIVVNFGSLSISSILILTISTPFSFALLMSFSLISIAVTS